MSYRESVYIIASEVGRIKIGVSWNEESRFRALQNSNATPLSLAFFREFERTTARRIEASAHRFLADKRQDGEWFKASVEEGIQAIAKAIIAVRSEKPRRVNSFPEVRKLMERANAIRVSVRELADRSGLAPKTIWKVWAGAGLLQSTFEKIEAAVAELEMETQNHLLSIHGPPNGEGQ